MPTPLPAPASAPEQPERSTPVWTKCEDQGGRLETRATAGGPIQVCVFPDGSECEAGALLRDDCSPGVRPTPSPTPTIEPAPSPEPSTEALLAQVQAALPANAFESLAVASLAVPAGGQPLWVVHSYGMRNYDLDPAPGHFVAIFAHDAQRWQEVSRIDLDAVPLGGDPLVDVGPDTIAEDGVRQALIDPARLWLLVDGGAGAHSGTFQVLSFNGQTLRQEVGGASSSPGAGTLADLDGDGQQEVILNTTERSIFCYACGVSAPYFEVYAWDGQQMRQVALSPLGAAGPGQPYGQANDEAVRLAQANLWPDALARIDEAAKLAGSSPAATAVRWNQALITLYHDAYLEALQTSAYPLLSQVFYGDYAGAVDLMREVGVAEIFSPETALVKGTAAEGWEDALATYLVKSAADALAVQPDLAPAYFVRAWGRYLADPSDPQVRGDLAQADALTPADPLFSAAVGALAAPTARP